MSFRLRLSTPDKTFIDADADEITCPGLHGYFGILTGHEPMISGLDTGIIKVKTGTQVKHFVVDTGLIEVRGSAVDLFVNYTEPAASSVDADSKLEQLKIARQSRQNLYDPRMTREREHHGKMYLL